jgi:carbonic anhydrase
MASCSSSNAPRDLIQVKSQECSLKCDYAHNYPMSSIIGNHQGEYLSFTFDTQSHPPVVFNQDKYNVSSMRIYTPSLHTFNGKQADAECIIYHKHLEGIKELLVCIPLRATSNGDNFIDTMIQQMSKMANQEGTNTQLQIPSFTLQSIIPQSSYYYYEGTLPYPPCNTNQLYDYLVFETPLEITSSSLTLLQKLISKQSYPIRKGDEIQSSTFYHSFAPSNTLQTGNDDVYIECQPTGEDGEILVPSSNTSSTTSTSSNSFLSSLKLNKHSPSTLLSNPIVKLILILLAVFVVITLMKWGMNSIGKYLLSTTNSTTITTKSLSTTTRN